MTEGESKRNKNKGRGYAEPSCFFPELSAGFQQSGKVCSITSSYTQKLQWKKIKEQKTAQDTKNSVTY